MLRPTNISMFCTLSRQWGSFRRRRFHGNILSPRRDTYWRLPVGPGSSSSSAICGSAGCFSFLKSNLTTAKGDPESGQRHQEKNLSTEDSPQKKIQSWFSVGATTNGGKSYVL